MSIWYRSPWWIVRCPAPNKATGETVASKNRNRSFKRPTCRQPWTREGGLAMEQARSMHQVPWMVPETPYDTRTHHVEAPPAPDHVIPLCCPRLVLIDHEHPEHDTSWRELPARHMEWAPAFNQNTQQWQLDSTLEVDGVAARWPLRGDIGSDGCRIDVLEADGTWLRLCQRCCCHLCCPVGWRLVGQVHLDWRACHSSTPYIWPGRLTAGVLLEHWIPNVKTARHKRKKIKHEPKNTLVDKWKNIKKKMPVLGNRVATTW